MKDLLCLLVLVSTSIVTASAQGDSLYTIEDVLGVTKVRSVLDGMPEQFLAAFEQRGPDAPAPSEEVRRLAAERFADSTLYRYVLEGMRERSDEEVLDSLTAWLFSDWATEARAAVDAYEPAQTLEEYAQGLQAAPPAEARVRLMAQFVAANRAGPFYVGLLEANREAVRGVSAALGEEVSATWTALTEAQKAGLARRYEGFALVSFLHRYEPLSDEQLARFVAAYESESGRWYVAAYSAAVAGAVRRAGRELAASLE